LVQTGATLVVFGFALLCFGAIWASLIGRGGWSILWGILALIVGGFVCAKEPVRALTVVVARLAFFVLLVSAIVLVVIRLQEGRISMAVLDWVVVTGFVWIALLVFARSRGWRIAPEADVRSATFSGGGRSSGWSSGWSSIGSSSGSSSWSSSSSSSGSSYSGGGGRSGGGGSSGSW
jgi:hypothetical protein